MAYGIEIYNEFGEEVFDFGSTVVIRESGVTKSAEDIGIAEFVVASWQLRFPSTHEVFTFAGGTTFKDAYPHFIGTGYGEITGVTTNQRRFPIPLVPRSSLYFYQVGEVGLLHHSEHFIDNHWSTNADPEFGGFAMCVPADNTPLPYLRVDAEPVSGLSGAYGMQILDENGLIRFDSRSQFLSISEVRFVPKATITDIIDNNAVVDLTLRTAVPDCYVAAPNHTSFFLPNNGGHYQNVKITQTSDTNIRLSRHLHGPFLSNTAFASFGVSNDLVLIVARDPFA